MRLRHRSPSALALVLLCIAVGLLGVGHAPPVAAQGSFTFVGGGWGHGVGMSQWGARGMAANGSSYTSILQHYYTGTSVVPSATSNDLKVLVTERAGSISITTGGITNVAGNWNVPGGQAITFTRVGDAVRLSGAINHTLGSSLRVTYSGTVLNVSPPGYGYRYGSLLVKVDPAGGLRAIVEGLPMQQYLYGIGEMPSSWPAEALKAQATASRTFAQKRRNARGAADFDLYGSVLHQAYTGTRFEAPNWTNAVDATDERVITYPGIGLIDAVYSASSGGHTENSEVVWVAPVPYLRARPDPHDAAGGNPNGSWSRTYTGAQLGSWFGLGTVTSVQILGPLGASGRVDKATIRLVGTGGSRDVTGASFRSTINARTSSQLMSTRFSLANQPAWTNTMPTGHFHYAFAEGRRIVVGGDSRDPDGAPLVRVVSTMGSQRAVRDVRSNNGQFLVAWNGEPGTRTICVTVYDVPTGAGVSLGCRDVVVK